VLFRSGILDVLDHVADENHVESLWLARCELIERFAKESRFVAQEVLAKHDENYMPPELADMHIEPENQ
jgi:hypothetical protein